MEIDLAYDSGIKLKDSYEFMARKIGARYALGYTKQDQKNYHYSKQKKNKNVVRQGVYLNTFRNKGKRILPFIMQYS